MRFLRLVLINIKRQLKNPMMILMAIAFPVGLLYMINGGAGDNSMKIGILDNAASVESKALIETLKKDYDVNEEITGDVKNHLKLIEDGELSNIYVIDKNFSIDLNKGNIPKIKVYRTSDGMGNALIDTTIEDFTKEKFKEKNSNIKNNSYIETELVMKELNSKNKYVMLVLMISYFMMLSGTTIIEELIKFKQAKVLKRTMTTANTDKQIMGSLVCSSFLIQGSLAIIAFKIAATVLDVKIISTVIPIIVILLASLFSTSLILAVTRWIKNISIASLVGTLVSLLLFILGMLNSNSSIVENPPEILKIGIISPFLWMAKMLETGEIIVPAIIIILMACVLFTLGSFKMREFIKE